MNEPTIRLEVRPEVSAFVDQVRARLSDLSGEDREDLVCLVSTPLPCSL